MCHVKYISCHIKCCFLSQAQLNLMHCREMCRTDDGDDLYETLSELDVDAERSINIEDTQNHTLSGHQMEMDICPAYGKVN